MHRKSAEIFEAVLDRPKNTIGVHLDRGRIKGYGALGQWLDQLLAIISNCFEYSN